MANSRVKERFELAMDARQVIAVLLGSLIILGGVFVLGITVGRQQSPTPAAVATVAAPKDALARLDDPIAARDEPAPELKAHQALTDGRAIEKTLPVPQLKTTAVSIAAQAPAAVAPPGADPVIQPPPAPEPAPAAAAKPAAPAPTTPSVAASAPSRRTVERKTRPAPVRAQPAAKRGAYAIQVASVPRRADAERLARKLSARNPRIVTADVPGKGRWYRVLVGSFETQDAAKRQAASLTRSGVHGIVTAMR